MIEWIAQNRNTEANQLYNSVLKFVYLSKMFLIKTAIGIMNWKYHFVLVVLWTVAWTVILAGLLLCFEMV